MISFEEKTKTLFCSSYSALGQSSIVGGVFQVFLSKKIPMDKFIEEMSAINIDIVADSFNEIINKDYIKDLIRDDIDSLAELGIKVKKVSLILSKL